ncbi:hypothetical protein RB195_016402 [Necator americanus]|uniref:Uncharacterized protein n=1 Tax=Necator americanus TaxID=51031 RepID=A0ABR1E9L3_NECAM
MGLEVQAKKLYTSAAPVSKMGSLHLFLFATLLLIISTFTTETAAQLMLGGIYGGGMMNCGFGGWGMGYMGMYGGLGCGLGVGGFLGR